MNKIIKNKNGNKYIWIILNICSIILFVYSITIYDGIKCYILILISLYLFIGTFIKLYNMNKEFKNFVNKIVKIIFWYI